MNIKINTKFSDQLNKDEYEITIMASEMTPELSVIINNIQNLANKKISIITAEKDNKIYLLETEKIEKFYSKNQNVYCMYQNKSFKIKKKLYELEELLDNKIFIRISNSCIINIKQIECFDTRNYWQYYCKI